MTAPADPVVFSRADGVFDIRLTDSAGGNLISNAAGDRIVAALANLDEGVTLVRISSDGPTFCVGRVSPMPPPGSRVDARSLKTTVAEPALRVYEALRNAPVPVLAAVRGDAHGYGCALVVACDIAIATEDARFRVPEMERGIPPLLVMTAMMGRVPLKTVAFLALSRDAISAQEALAAGILSQVVHPDAFDQTVATLSNAIGSAPPDAVRAIKEYLRMAPDATFATASTLAANLTGTALARRFFGP